MRVRDELCGRSIGEFVLRERIGEGGFGAVYRCEQPLLGREAVIKVLHSRLRSSEVVIQRFLREARIASHIDHPYAAHVYAFGVEKDDGLLWIAMEMVHGTPLDRWLRDRGPLPLAELVPFFERIAEVVQTAHERGIVHRDLKPSNVMVIERAGRLLPKLLDLGIAKLLEDDATGRNAPPVPPRNGGEAAHADTIAAQRPSEVDTMTASNASPERALGGDLTEDGAAMGSPPYMAPEQWHDGAISPRTDLYALGVVAYEALSGRRPFVATTVAGYAQLHANEAPPPLGDHPAALDRFFTRALAKRPVDRFGTALELAAALRVASGLAQAFVDIPKLERAVHDRWVADAPQPLAEAVAALDGAHNPHEARDAARELVRTLMRYLLALGLASRAQVRDPQRDATLDELLRSLRRRELDDDERVRLLRRLVRPFAERHGAHPIPALVRLVLPPEGEVGVDEDALARVLQLGVMSDPRAFGDDVVRSQLAQVLPAIATLLRAAAFALDYTLVVGRRGGAEDWMGIRRTRRPTVAAAVPLDERQPCLVDRDGARVLALWPLVQVAAPRPGADDELFLFDGHGRRGARLVSSPHGFERHDATLWDWLGEHVVAPSSDDAPSGPDERAPYLGLDTFAATDADLFVGREREVDTFINLLRTSPLQLIVGASGAGKSSFVHAGVLPALPVGWRTTTMRPGSRPIATLATKLAALDRSTDPVTDWAARLESSPTTAAAALTRLAGDGAIAIVVDQLEELFTMCRSDDERGRFIAALDALTATADTRVRVVATLRDDFLMRAAAQPILAPRMASSVFFLGNPSREDLIRTIVEPARWAGYELSDGELAPEMVDAVAGRPGALALLSFTAAQLWELRDRRFRQLSRKVYEAMGGVGGALGRHAEQTLEALGQEHRRLVREVFRHLVTAEGTRAQLGVRELVDLLGAAQARDVIDKLVGARLLVVADHEDGARVEVIHEALLTAWPRVQQWIREDAEGARLRDQVRAAAKQWADRDRDAGLLWRGDALAEYQVWRNRHPGRLTDTEEAFAAASLAEAVRGRRLRRGVVIGAVALLGVTVVVLLQARNTAVRDRNQIAEMARASHQQYVEQLEDAARRAMLDSDSASALPSLVRAYDAELRTPALGVMLVRAIAPRTAQLQTLRFGHPVRWAELAPDAKRVLAVLDGGRVVVVELATGAERVRTTVPGDAFTAHFDRTGARVVIGGTRPQLWTLASDASVALPTDGALVSRTAFTADGEQVLLMTDKKVLLADTRDGALVERLATANAVTGAPDPTGRAIAVVEDRVLWIVEAATRKRVHRLEGHEGYIEDIAFSPDGSLVATASFDRTARLWDPRTGTQRAVLVHDMPVGLVAISARGEYVATASGASARVWNFQGKLVATMQTRLATIATIAFSSDGTRVVTGADDGRACIHDVATGSALGCLEGHTSKATAAHLFDPDRALTASIDGTVRVWRTDRHAFLHSLAHDSELSFAAFTRDGAMLATGDHAGAVSVWDAHRGTRRWSVKGHAGFVGTVKFDPAGRHLLTIAVDGLARLWDPATGTLVRTMRASRGEYVEGTMSEQAIVLVTNGGEVDLVSPSSGSVRSVAVHRDRIRAVAIDATGTRVATASDDSTAAVVDLASASVAHRLTGHGGPVNDIAFSSDGLAIATTSEEGALRVWTSAGALRHTMATFGAAASPRFDHAGALVLAAHEDGTVRMWSTSTGAPIPTARSHDANVWFLDIHPTKPFAVSASKDGTAIVWDLARPGGIVRLDAHVQPLRFAAFSPAGDALVTTSFDRTAKIWRFDDGGGDLADEVALAR